MNRNDENLMVREEDREPYGSPSTCAKVHLKRAHKMIEEGDETMARMHLQKIQGGDLFTIPEFYQAQYLLAGLDFINQRWEKSLISFGKMKGCSDSLLKYLGERDKYLAMDSLDQEVWEALHFFKLVIPPAELSVSHHFHHSCLLLRFNFKAEALRVLREEVLPLDPCHENMFWDEPQFHCLFTAMENLGDDPDLEEELAHPFWLPYFLIDRNHVRPIDRIHPVSMRYLSETFQRFFELDWASGMYAFKRELVCDADPDACHFWGFCVHNRYKKQQKALHACRLAKIYQSSKPGKN